MFDKLLSAYIPTCEQEVVDKKAMLSFIERNNDVLDRENLVAHLTSSALVVNQNMDKVLFAHHNIYNSWGWVGGHNDGNGNMLQVAIKEAKEETGINKVIPYSENIISIDTIYVENHLKNGKYIPDHLHLNATFLLIADENEKLTIKADENSGVKWFRIDEVMDYVTEYRIKTVYQKLFIYIDSLKNRK